MRDRPLRKGRVCLPLLYIFTSLVLFISVEAYAAIIQVISPKPGEKWLKGHTYSIEWISSGTPKGTKLKVALRHGQVKVTTLDRNLIAINGKKQSIKWNVASNTPSGEYSIIVKSMNGGLASQSVSFTIGRDWVKAAPESSPAGQALTPAVPAGKIIPNFIRKKCTEYSYKALLHNELNKLKKCGFTGPRWNSVYDSHYKWCVSGNNYKMADGETKFRDEALDLCTHPGYAVKIYLDRVRVTDDCDNVSKGEWALYLKASAVDRHGKKLSIGKQWPSNGGVMNVDTGARLYPGMLITLMDVKPTSDIELYMTGVDCDENTIWFAWDYNSFPADFQVNCPDEDFPEASGSNDWMGDATLKISPQQWQSLGEKGGQFVIMAPRGTPCSDTSPYSAYIKIQSYKK
jgi:hypothetical protein